jgi:hypothetical protein
MTPGLPSCTYCPAGTYSNVTGSSFCLPCLNGKFSHVGASECQSCSAS